MTRPDGTIITAKRGRPGLTKDAFPTIFANQPKYMTKEVPPARTTLQERNDRIIAHDEMVLRKWMENDNINSFGDFCEAFIHKLSKEWLFVSSDDYVAFFKANCDDRPKLTVSFKVMSDLTVLVWYENRKRELTFQCEQTHSFTASFSAAKCFENFITVLKHTPPKHLYEFTPTRASGNSRTVRAFPAAFCMNISRQTCSTFAGTFTSSLNPFAPQAASSRQEPRTFFCIQCPTAPFTVGVCFWALGTGLPQTTWSLHFGGCSGVLEWGNVPPLLFFLGKLSLSCFITEPEGVFKFYNDVKNFPASGTLAIHGIFGCGVYDEVEGIGFRIGTPSSQTTFSPFQRKKKCTHLEGEHGSVWGIPLPEYYRGLMVGKRISSHCQKAPQMSADGYLGLERIPREETRSQTTVAYQHVVIHSLGLL
ncbi:hypothetical protein GWK47_053160 [Chionoecetes opilio]|uniref:Uncharacterized protein n=1 Tax=Chionoecetes opilio TaxID=41210 RepID=A0A8J4Y6D8_CHIOP|nr:hypothetical protein GWK47_053160 [Chionoecetes opilio]